MPKLFGNALTRQELMRRVGRISQAAGIRRTMLLDGVEKGVESIEIRSGSGFNIAVLPTRGMKVAHAEWRGAPLAWVSPSAAAHPAHLNAHDDGGGLLASFGLQDVGPSTGGRGQLPRIPAKNITADARWEGSALLLAAQGLVRETGANGEQLTLTRRIAVRAGEHKMRVVDLIENTGYVDSPFMYMYRIHVGYPALDEGAELILSARGAEPADGASEAGMNDRFRFTAPAAESVPQTFYYDAVGDENRHVWAAVVNKRFNGGQGIGVYVRYHQTQFPNFIQLKRMGEGFYSAGMAPANCRAEGVEAERERGTLEYIEAGGRRHFETEIGVLTNQQQIGEFEERAARIRSL